MPIAKRLKAHLENHEVPFAVLDHPYTATTLETAQAAHVPGDQLAKSVVVHLEDGPILAVVPSTRQVDLDALKGIVDRRLNLAPEGELDEVFHDCAEGAAPPIGAAYGVPVVLDNSLSGLDQVWFEAGDHRTLVKVAGRHFDRLMKTARRGAFCSDPVAATV